jgi:predicted RNA-binding Zn-ribbon protein involved in translation (DUF1610 family)
MDIYANVSSSVNSHFAKSRTGRPTTLSKAKAARISVPDVRTFFRHCPSCGRRFEVRLVRKESLGQEDIPGTMTKAAGRYINPRNVNPGNINPAPVLLTEDEPAVVDIEEFKYTYKCKHCGHEWTEARETEREFEAPKGYTGD